MKVRSALTAVVLLAACSSSERTSSPGATVTVDNMAFLPATITVKAGDTVTWSWKRGVHNVVSGTSCTPDGAFSSGPPEVNGTFERQFPTPGTFDYFCETFCAEGMVGKLVVE